MKEFFLFMGMVVGGVLIEIILSRMYFSKFQKNKESIPLLVKFGFLLFLPLIAIIVMFARNGIGIFYAFLSFALVGTFFEWLIGYSYEEIVGKRLWTYHSYIITKYTSVLSIPLWGLCGVMFWLLAFTLTR